MTNDTIFKRTYQNRQGITFSITASRATVPDGAKHYGYCFRVVCQDGYNRHFRAGILKSFFPKLIDADAFIAHEPLTYLFHQYLDYYQDGETPLYWPDFESPNWFVF